MTYLDPIRQAAQEFAPPPTEPEHHFGDFDKEDPALKPQQASMVSHWDDFDKEAPPEGDTGEPAPGSLKRTGREYARGIYRGVLGLGGAIHDAPSALFQNKEMTTAAKWIHDLGLDPPEDATWYEKGANTLGQLTPGAITGVGLTGSLVKPIIADLVASQITGPAGEKIGAKLGLGPGRSQLLGIGTSIAGSAGAAAGVSRVAGRFRPPTGEQILDSATKGYKAVENMPITWDPTALATNVTAPIARQMENSGADLTAPTAYKMLGKLQPTADESNGVSLGRLWGVQKNLKELAKQTDAQGHYTSDAHYAGQTVKSINQFMEAAQDNPNWALSGSEHLPTMSSTLAKANQDYSSAMWDDTFGKAYDKAKLRASTVTTGGNLPNNVRQEFAKFLDPFHPARALGLKPDELAQVNQIARGANRTQNLLRGLGGVAPESKLGLYAQATGLGMAAGGNLGGLMLPAVGVMGSLAKRASNRLQKGQIENLRNTVRSRSALAQSMRNGPHGGSAGEEAGEAAEAGLAGVLGEEAPEWVNRAAGAGADTGANAEKEDRDKDKDKEADTGGYAMGHRLLKAVGGYDSSFFSGDNIADQATTEVAINQASGATPKDILRSVTSPTAQAIGQGIATRMMPMKSHGGGYDDPRQEAFADPEAFRLRMARLAAMPRTGVGGSSLTPQTGIGGGMPMGRYQVGGYDWPWSLKGAKSRPEPVDTGNTGSKYGLFGSFSTVTRPKPPPRGGSSMQDPQSDDGGGYDDSRMPRSRNVIDRTGYDESKLHWPWTIHANEKKFYPQGDPVFQAPVIPPPVYTGQLGAAAGINNIPGPVPTVGATGPINFGGGYGLLHTNRRRGGYGMGQVSPLAGGGGY